MTAHLKFADGRLQALEISRASERLEFFENGYPTYIEVRK